MIEKIIFHKIKSNK